MMPEQAARNDPRLRLKGAALAALTAAVVASVAPMTQHFEGFRGRVYRDPVGILTQCYGETAYVRPDLIYSKDECAAKLRARMAKDYGPQIVACIPDLANPLNRLAYAAALDASYNAGPGGVCRSSFAKAFNAGRWDQGCRLIVGWRATAKGVPLPGLTARRRAERDYCLSGKLP
jgi:lysozyme